MKQTMSKEEQLGKPKTSSSLRQQAFNDLIKSMPYVKWDVIGEHNKVDVNNASNDDIEQLMILITQNFPFDFSYEPLAKVLALCDIGSRFILINGKLYKEVFEYF